MISKWLPFSPTEGSYLGFLDGSNNTGIGYKSADEKTFYWYTYEENMGYAQFNAKGIEYWYIAFF